MRIVGENYSIMSQYRLFPIYLTHCYSILGLRCFTKLLCLCQAFFNISSFFVCFWKPILLVETKRSCQYNSAAHASCYMLHTFCSIYNSCRLALIAYCFRVPPGTSARLGPSQRCHERLDAIGSRQGRKVSWPPRFRNRISRLLGRVSSRRAGIRRAEAGLREVKPASAACGPVRTASS